MLAVATAVSDVLCPALPVSVTPMHSALPRSPPIGVSTPVDAPIVMPTTGSALSYSLLTHKRVFLMVDPSHSLLSPYDYPAVVT